MSNRMPAHLGLHGRARNQDGQIRRKNRNTEVGTLRDIYGAGFALGARSDMHLNTLLKRNNASSLNQYLKSKT